MRQRDAQYWREHGGPGSIVNVVVVTERGMPGVAHTVAARAGIIGASRTVAVEWAPLGIRVNCVARGLTATEGLEVYPTEAVKEFPLANPMKRQGTAMEIRSEEHTSELQSLMRIWYAVFCLKQKNQNNISCKTQTQDAHRRTQDTNKK